MEPCEHRSISHHDAELFWSAVGVGEEALQVFAALDPRFHGGMLKISSSQDLVGDVHDRLEGLLTYPWTFRRHNTARFMIIGNGCRKLLIARLVGLDRIVAMGRSQPGASDYWLHHYSGIERGLQSFVAACAMGCGIADKLLRQLLEDCRVPWQAASLRAIIDEEMAHLHQLPPWVWKRLTATIDGGADWQALRTEALRIARVTAAWFDVQVLQHAIRPPWSFAAMEPMQGVQALLTSDDSQLDAVSMQLRNLVTQGLATQVELASCLTLLSQCSWSTLDVEQSHGSLAVMHRYHGDAGAEHLSIRSYIHMCRSIFTQPLQELALARLQQKLAATHRRNPNRLRSTSLWLGENNAIVRAAIGSETPRPLRFWQDQAKTAATRWLAMDEDDRHRFAAAAEEVRDQQWQERRPARLLCLGGMGVDMR